MWKIPSFWKYHGRRLEMESWYCQMPPLGFWIISTCGFMGWSDTYFTLNFLQIRVKTEFRQICSKDCNRRDRHGSERACCTGGRCSQAACALPQGRSLPASSAPRQIQMGTLCHGGCGLLLAFASTRACGDVSEVLFPRQGSHVKSTWCGYGKNIKEKGSASPGLSGFKLLKRTKLSPSLLKQERPPGLCHGCGAGCTWRGESLQT